MGQSKVWFTGYDSVITIVICLPGCICALSLFLWQRKSATTEDQPVQAHQSLRHHHYGSSTDTCVTYSPNDFLWRIFGLLDTTGKNNIALITLLALIYLSISALLQ